MADSKVTDLGAPAGGLALADIFYIVDVSDTTDDPAGSSRQDTLTNLKTLMNTAVVFTTSADLNGVELILDADADTSITADTDDQIDIRINGADDFRFVANVFRALSGSSLETDTINETTGAAGVTIDSVLLKDNGVTANNYVVNTGILPDANDGAYLGQAGTAFSDLFLAEGAVINWDSGDFTITQTGNDLIFAGGTVVLPAADTGDPGVQLQVGTLQTTPEVGGIELDTTNFYGTTDAGNRGVIPVIHYLRAASDQTLTSTTNAQNIFDSPANGTITLETGVYLFEMMAIITGMSATSGNGQILFAGTGTFGDWMWRIQGLDNSTPSTISADLSAYFQTGASAASAVTAAAGTALRLYAQGSFECSVAGTLIPQIDLVTAAAATVEAGSWFSCMRVGAASMTSVGQWS